MADPKKQAKGRAKLDELAAGAVEAEADRDRYRMEEAILASAAASKPDNPFHWTFLKAFPGKLTFSRSDLAAIAQAVRSCMVERIAPDDIIIRDRLKSARADVKDGVLTAILDGSKAVDGSVAEVYIGKLDALDRFRRADAAGHSYLSAVLKAKDEGGDVDAAVGNLLKAVFDLAQSKKLVTEYQTEHEGMAAFMVELEDRGKGGEVIGLQTGFKHLDEVFNGLMPGVYVFAGAPSCGKTTLLKQIADHVAEEEKTPVLFFSYEQSAEELRIKTLARILQIDSRKIWKGRTDKAWSEIRDAITPFIFSGAKHLQIVEAGREDTLDRIRAAALMAKHKAGDKPILLIIDYLQIIPAEGRRFDSIREKVDWHLSELRRLARDLKSPVLVISSENREAYKGNPEPTMAALKESGGIEYSADAVICLWRDNKESETLTRDFGRTTVRVELHVLKNRNGELAKVKLDFTPAWAVFGNESRAEGMTWSAALGK